MFSGLPDITIAQLMQRLVAGAIVLAVYGYAATRATEAVGDPGPKHDGRRTLNPIVHLDVMGVLAMVFFRSGWMRPLALDTNEFRHRRRDSLVVLAVATTSLVVLAVTAFAARQFALRLFAFDVGITISTVLLAVSEVAVGTAILGLLPIPPLLGSLWWSVLRPGSERVATHPRVVLVGYVVMTLILLSGIAAPLMGTLTNALTRQFGF